MTHPKLPIYSFEIYKDSCMFVRSRLVYSWINVLKMYAYQVHVRMHATVCMYTCMRKILRGTCMYVCTS